MKKFLALLLLLASPAWGQSIYPDGSIAVNTEGRKTTCSAAFDTTAYVTPTDLWIINGSATRLVRIVRIMVTGRATGATQMDFLGLKRSTADSGGTPTSITPVQWDSASAPCTATVTSFGAAPTTGTLVGDQVDWQTNFPAATGGNPTFPLPGDFGVNNAKAIVLRGVGEGFALNFAGVAWPAGGTMSTTVIWTEE